MCVMQWIVIYIFLFFLFFFLSPYLFFSFLLSRSLSVSLSLSCVSKLVLILLNLALFPVADSSYSRKHTLLVIQFSSLFSSQFLPNTYMLTPLHSLSTARFSRTHFRRWLRVSASSHRWTWRRCIPPQRSRIVCSSQSWQWGGLFITTILPSAHVL